MALPTATLSTLLTDVENAAFDDHVVVTGLTATGGSTTTVVDSARTEPDDRFSGWHVYIATDAGGAGAAPEGEERRITDFANSTGTFTVEYAFTAAVASSDTYEIRKVWSRAQELAAINWAIRMGADTYDDLLRTGYNVQASSPLSSGTICFSENMSSYPLPSSARHVYQIWQSNYDTDDSGTATSATSTTLTDSTKAWTVSEHVNKLVCIYNSDDPTATDSRTQVRLITANTATALTVAAWTTTPAASDSYVILDTVESSAKPTRILDAHIDWAGQRVWFGKQYSPGQLIELVYTADPAQLSAATDTTSIPEGYILLAAQAFLWQSVAGDPKLGRMADFWARYYHEQAQQFKDSTPQVMPADTLWNYSAVAEPVPPTALTRGRIGRITEP